MKIHRLIISLVLILSVLSCKEEKDTSSDTATKANIIGDVNLYDEGVKVVNDDGMTVKIEGLTPSISATTDDTGEYTLTDVPFGTYTLTFEKIGYGTFKIMELEHSNTGSSTIIKHSPSLGKSSTTKIVGLSVNKSDDKIVLSTTTSSGGSNGNDIYIRYFLSNSHDVNNSNYKYFSPGLTARINPLKSTITKDELIERGFSSGETVYVKVYGDSFWSNKYEDTKLGKIVFPNLNTSSTNAVSFIVP